MDNKLVKGTIIKKQMGNYENCIGNPGNEFKKYMIICLNTQGFRYFCF